MCDSRWPLSREGGGSGVIWLDLPVPVAVVIVSG